MSLSNLHAFSLRLKGLRYYKQLINILDLEKVTSSGNMEVADRITLLVEEGDSLVVRFEFVSNIKSKPGQENTEDLGRIELSGESVFELPADHGLEVGELADVQTEDVETFIHLLEPMYLSKMKALLAEAGVNSAGIPLHVYIPKSVRNLNK